MADCLYMGIFTGLVQHLKQGGIFSFSFSLGLVFLLLYLVLGMGNRITMLEEWYHRKSVGDSAFTALGTDTLPFTDAPAHSERSFF